MRSIGCTVLCVASVLVHVAACSKEDPDNKPVDAKVWREKNKVALDAFHTKLASAVALIKDLPATSAHIADPEVPLNLFVANYNTGNEPPFEQQNAVIVQGVDVPGLPEYGSDRDKSLESGDRDISVNYMGYVDWDLLNSLVDTGKPKYDTKAVEANNVVRDLGRLRYLIITRKVAYTRGTIDATNKTFTPGTYQGVAHVVDLQGPKLLGSVAYSGTNTGSFESYSGSEKFILQMDLEGQTMNSFAAELRKTFPKLWLPDPPAKK